MVECEAIHRARSLPRLGDAGKTRATWTDGTGGATWPGMAAARRTHGTSATRGTSEDHHTGRRLGRRRAIHRGTIPRRQVTLTVHMEPTSRTSIRHGKARAC